MFTSRNHVYNLEQTSQRQIGLYADGYWNRTEEVHGRLFDVYRAMCAFGRRRLAVEEDRSDTMQALRDYSPNKYLFDLLVDNGACVGGLQRVGCYAESLYHLGELIRQLDGSEESDSFGYLAWCLSSLPYSCYMEVLDGFTETAV